MKVLVITYWKNFELLNQELQVFADAEKAEEAAELYNKAHFKTGEKYTSYAVVVGLNTKFEIYRQSEEVELAIYN